jgi:quercetin dioxygenase-like cupin family protein
MEADSDGPGGSLLDKLVCAAARVATEQLPPGVESQREIGRLMDAILPEQLGLEQAARHGAHSAVDAAPQAISTQIICANRLFELVIFVFPKHASIPMHDHPRMTVFSKVLYGSLAMRAYDWVQPLGEEQLAEMDAEQARLHERSGEDLLVAAPLLPPRKVHCRADTVLTAESPTFCLRPSFCNLHSFQALGECAVLDLLMPPYDDDAGRDCHYFSFNGQGGDEDQPTLVVAPPPDDLVIRNAPYEGLRPRLPG